jgi:hypothetical protein
VRARAERQQTPVTLGRYVEVLAVLLPVRPLGADRDDSAGREGHAAVLQRRGADPRGERRDRLGPEHLVDRAGRLAGLLAQQLPLARMRGEHPHRVRQLRLGGVDAPGDDVQHQVDALGMGQPVATVLRGQQGGDQVVPRLRPPPLQQRLDVVLDLDDRALDLGHLAGERRDVELPLHQAGPLVESRRVAVRGAEHRGDRQRRVGLGQGGNEVAGR